MHKFTTDFGLFQYAYSGTPLTSYLDVGYAFPGGFPQDIVNRGKWIDVTQSSDTGAINISAPYTKRTPWYTQSDFNLMQGYKTTESTNLSFSATFTNLLNQHSVVSEGQQIDSGYAQNFVAPGGQDLFNGAAFYAAAMRPYNIATSLNSAPSNVVSGAGPVTVNSQYGKPYLFQTSRNIRLTVRFTF